MFLWALGPPAEAKRSSGDHDLDAIRLLVPKADYLWSVFTDPRAAGMHQAVDIAAAGGSRIKAFDKGVVIGRGRHESAGKWVDVDHGDGRVTRYLHLRRFKVREGEQVRRGECIGKVGRTGNAWKVGHHLHFELVVHGTRVDPMPYLLDVASERYRW